MSHLKKNQNPAVLPRLRDTDSNLTAYRNFLITYFNLAYCVEIPLKLGGAVCRLIPQLWQIFGSSIGTAFEITERSVSSIKWLKAEQQSIAVLHSRQCQSSNISVQNV